jgi:PTH2 family peptidyl-tRNA hydrolase
MKQVLLIREDIDMSEGKAIAQGSHASVLSVREADEKFVQTWLSENAGTKITLSVSSEEELRSLIDKADEKSLPTGIISDLGRTELEAGTTTAGAIGPAEESLIDDITGDLSLYK